MRRCVLMVYYNGTLHHWSPLGWGTYLSSHSLSPPSPGVLSPWRAEEWTVVMETQSQASSAAEKKKRVETIVATKGSSARADISEKAVASSTTSNGKSLTYLNPSFLTRSDPLSCSLPRWSLLSLSCLFVVLSHSKQGVTMSLMFWSWGWNIGVSSFRMMFVVECKTWVDRAYTNVFWMHISHTHV